MKRLNVQGSEGCQLGLEVETPTTLGQSPEETSLPTKIYKRACKLALDRNQFGKNKEPFITMKQLSVLLHLINE